MNSDIVGTIEFPSFVKIHIQITFSSEFETTLSTVYLMLNLQVVSVLF